MKTNKIRKIINIVLIVIQVILLITAIVAIKFTEVIYSYTHLAGLYFYNGTTINSYNDTYLISVLCCILIPFISFFIYFKSKSIKVAVFKVILKVLLQIAGCLIGFVFLWNYTAVNGDSKISVIASPTNDKEIIVEEFSNGLDMSVSVYEYADKYRNVVHRIYNSSDKYYYHIDEELYRIAWEKDGVYFTFLNYSDKSVEKTVYMEFDY